MTSNQQAWAAAREELSRALKELGYPEEFAGLLAKQLGSPRAIERMSAYLRRARPKKIEMIVDEMLAICQDADAWRAKGERSGAGGRDGLAERPGKVGGGRIAREGLPAVRR